MPRAIFPPANGTVERDHERRLHRVEHPGANTPLTVQGAVAIWSGVGAPATSSVPGSNGDLYIRQDGGAGTTIYAMRAGAWTAIL